MKLLCYCSYSASAFEHKHSTNMVRAFPTSTNVNEHTLLALGSDRTARDDVEQARVGSVHLFPRFSRMKPCETNVQQMLHSMLYVHSSISFLV